MRMVQYKDVIAWAVRITHHLVMYFPKPIGRDSM